MDAEFAKKIDEHYYSTCILQAQTILLDEMGSSDVSLE
ncbi:hypothetical protein CAL7102_03082 [Dulcicalothrix desertica PCC 7102]|nr:hypothetical protein CAL7102_03082 [Dulcicalothrix desertica PCC 7102]